MQEPSNSLPPETPNNLNRFSSNGTFGNNSQASASHAEHANTMWGLWQKTADWQDRLHKRAAHKALNIPEEDVITSTTVTNSGLGWKELLLIAALMAGTGAGAYYLSGGSADPISPGQEVETPEPLKLRVRVTPSIDGDHKIEVTE